MSSLRGRPEPSEEHSKNMATLINTIAQNLHFSNPHRDDRRVSSPPSYLPGDSNHSPSYPMHSAAAAPTHSAPVNYDDLPYRSRPSTGYSSQDELRQAYASQQHFDPRTQSSAYQNRNYNPQYDQEAIRAGANSAMQRSAYSSNDLTRYDGNTIKVKSLAHIESFAQEQLATEDHHHAAPNYDISDMPIGDVIEMVAGLLTKITATNDRQHEHLHRALPSQDQSAPMSGLTASVLAFHGKNVPSITVLSYLSRIHKYCPLTYEVFLSLLVYFDRMTERVNPRTFDDRDDRAGSERGTSRGLGASAWRSPDEEHEEPSTPISLSVSPSLEDVRQGQIITPPNDEEQLNLHNYFVVDSFNIHRLVIAGVTCASKFFSDTFYTNSRYAKVGGLPLPELNHLELQFLLLNDFRLAVPVEELEAYGTMLVEFYMRDVLAKRTSETGGMAYKD